MALNRTADASAYDLGAVRQILTAIMGFAHRPLTTNDGSKTHFMS